MAYGDGSIYPEPRDRPRYMVAVLDVGEAGRRLRKKRKVRIAEPATPQAMKAAKAEAEAALEELRRLYTRRGPVAVRTLGEFLAWWLDDVEASRVEDGDITPATLEQTRSHVATHLEGDPLVRVPLAELGAMHVHDWQRRLRSRGVSAAQRAKVLATLTRALKLAVRWEFLDRNPAELVDPPRRERVEGAAATIEDVRALVRDGGRWRNLYAVLAGLGLRIGEALALAWEDVDLEGGSVTVGASLSRPKGAGGARAWRRSSTKTRRTRVLPLPGFVADALVAEGAVQATERALTEGLGEPWRDSWGLVFTRADGQPVHASNVNRALAGDCERLGLQPLSPHALRRSCASVLAALGVPTRVRMDVLGHATARMTEEVYTRAFTSDVAAAMRALDGAFGAVGSPDGSPPARGV